MFSTNVEYFCEFWFLLYEKIMRFSPWKIGKYTRWASCWDQYSWVAAIPEDCHLCTEISKRRTIMQATVAQGFLRTVMQSLKLKHHNLKHCNLIPYYVTVQLHNWPWLLIAFRTAVLGRKIVKSQECKFSFQVCSMINRLDKGA